MNKHYSLAANCLVILSVISLNIFATKISAQESIDNLDRPNVPLDDQVRFIGELESRNSTSERWNFAMEQSYLNESPDRLTISEPRIPVRLIEQDKPEWDNTGQAPKYSILFYLYGEDLDINRYQY